MKSYVLLYPLRVSKPVNGTFYVTIAAVSGWLYWTDIFDGKKLQEMKESEFFFILVMKYLLLVE